MYRTLEEMAEDETLCEYCDAEPGWNTSSGKSVQSSAERLRSTITGGFGFGIMAGAGQKAFSVISGGINDVISGLNESSAAWKTFQGNMEMSGKGEKQIKSTKKQLQKFAQQTVYSASDMASTYAQLSAVGTKNTTKLVKGFGGLAAAAENPQQAMKTLSQQATQMAAKPNVAWEDFKLMLEQTPAGVSAVAKTMGMSTTEMIKNIQDGKIATEDFFEAVAKTGTNADFTKLATEYKTVDQAMDGLKETVANKLQPAFDTLSGIGIRAISKISDAFDKIDGNGIAEKITGFVDKAKPYWDVFKDNVLDVKDAFGEAVGAISDSLGDLTGAFGSAESVENFGDAIGVIKDGLVKFAGFLEDHADIIAKVITKLPKLLLAYKGFKIVKSIAPGLGTFAKGIGKLAAKGIGGIAGKLFGIAGGETAAGKAAKVSNKSMLAMAKSTMMLGAAVLMIAGGFALLALSAVMLANSGGVAIGVMFGLVGALAALAIGGMAAMKAFSQTPARAKGSAVALLALGAAVLMIAVGFGIMANAAISLAAAGAPAIACMFGLIAAMAGLALGAAVLGPALTAGAVGFIAFGVAIALVGAGALMAAVALSIVASVLPVVVQYGAAGAVAIVQLGAGMLVFAAGAAVAGAASLILGAGLIVAAAGMVLAGAGALIAAAGMVALAAGTALLGVSLFLVSASISLVAAVLPVAASGALMAGASFAVLLASTILIGPALLIAAAGLIVFGAGALVAGAGAAVFGAAMLVGSAGVIIMAGALKLVNSSMKTISGNAKSAEKSISSMVKSVDIVNAGLDALGDKAKSAIDKLLGCFDNAESKVVSSGQSIGNGFAAGIQPGLMMAAATAKASGKAVGEGFTESVKNGIEKAPAVVKKAVLAVHSSLMSGTALARSAGTHLSTGFAVGMESCLNRIEAAAARMVEAADKAIRVKAEIHSPSKLTRSHGRFLAIGLGLGIRDGINDVTKASKALVSSVGDTLKKASKTRLYEDAAGSAVDKFRSSVEKQVSKTTKSLGGFVDKTIKQLKEKNPKLKKEYSKVGKILKSDMSKTIKAQGTKAVNAADKALTALGKKYQEKYDKLVSDRDNYASKLSDYGSLYSSDSYGFVSLKDFRAETGQVKNLAKNMSKLKNVLPYDLMREIQDMDTASALAYTNELLKKSDSWLKQYGKDYTNFMNTSKNAAEQYYQPDINKLDKDYSKAVTAELKKLKKQMDSIGKQATDGFIQGLTNKKSKKELKKAADDLASILVKSVKGKLKIHSPSRVFAALGNYVGKGFAIGINAMQTKVADAMESLVSIPHVADPVLAGDFGGELSAEYDYYRSAQYTVVVPVELDGREVARVTAPYTEAELCKRQSRENRKHGFR